MDIIRQQRDDDNLGLWHFKIGGIAADEKYRLADLSRETSSPADWLAANQTEAQTLIDAGVYSQEYDTEIRRPGIARVDFRNLPGWATWTGQEADNWIATNVTDLASAKVALRAMARAIVYLRDIGRV